uniref:Reverse transcriptase domain-containing protein n=1 Tax=Tanacetum cinerariifolium TaxID=118510 RepID=A0A6L2L8G3_TANCI|nr:reverse transcriptase domain-containing protein [Tanacetum cinerariifolium]
MVRPNGQAPRSMEELCQPSINGRGGPIAPIPIQATYFVLRHHMIQQVQNTCQFHGLPGDDANRHIDKFLEITQHMKQNGVSDDALRLSLFLYSLTHHAIIWDTSAIRDETSRNISSTSTTESPEVVRQLEMMNNNFSEMMRQFQLVKAVNTKCKTCGGPHSFTECPSVGGYTQKTIYATTEPKLTIPYPSRANKQKLCEKDNMLALKFLKIFRNLHFELSFVDAFLHMPKFALMFKSLLNNKEKLFDLATTLVNKNCSAVILKKLPKKLGDPSKFLIPCDFPEFDECLALADLGMSINLMPLSIWKKLSLPELTSTQMILELADRSTTRPVGIAEDVFVKVGKFHFPTDFVAVDYVVDPHVSLILGRPFLWTGRALIDVYGEELTLRIDDEAITIKVGQTLKYSYNDAKSINRIDAIDVACEEYVQEGGDFILKEIEACLTSKSIPSGIDDIDFDLEGDIRLLEELLNKDPSSSPLPLKELNVEEIKTVKSSIDEPPELELKELPPWVSPVHCVPKKGGMTVVENKDNELIPPRLVTGWRICIDYQKLNDATQKDYFPLPFMDQMLERLARNEFYCFLDGFSEYFQILIDPQDQEKTTFTCPYGTFAYRRMPFGLCNALGTFQRCMMAIFHDMIEKTMEVFMNDFSVSGHSFSSSLSRLDKMLQRCEDTNLVLNWEKCHFMVQEGVVLGHIISKSKIEVDRAKVDVIDKLPHPTSVKYQVIRRCVHGQEAVDILTAFHNGPTGTSWIAPDFGASRARGFVHHPLELQSFAYGNSISEILLI